MGQLLWILLLTGLVQAEPYGLVVVDEVKQLDRPALQQAAQPLLQRGASVAVVLVRHGDERDVVKQLSQLGLWSGTQIAPSGVLVYVSLDPRYSQLRAGTRFSDDLSPAALEEIRQEMLNPQLRQEHFQQAAADSLQRMEQRLSHSLSAKDWIARITLTFLSIAFLKVFGFFGWLGDLFWESWAGRTLLRLWSLTPIARRKERARVERMRQQNLATLQERALQLTAARQRPQPMSAAESRRLDELQPEIDGSQQQSAQQLVELIQKVSLQSEKLWKRSNRWDEGDKWLQEAQTSLQRLKSQLKDRKKTRHLPEKSPFPELSEALQQEAQLRDRLLQEGADVEEADRSRERCLQLLERVVQLRSQHFPAPKSARMPVATQGYEVSSPPSDNGNYSSYDDRSSYDPPSSSSESVAGGDW